jgi:hypothetical protein
MEKHSLEAVSHAAQPRFGIKLISLLSCLCAAMLLMGCARHYDLTLTDGTRITNVTKPVLDRQTGVFSYKDVTGHVHQKNAAHVVEIAPHSSKNNPPGF